jgi:hypothetical protein
MLSGGFDTIGDALDHEPVEIRDSGVAIGAECKASHTEKEPVLGSPRMFRPHYSLADVARVCGYVGNTLALSTYPQAAPRSIAASLAVLSAQ